MSTMRDDNRTGVRDFYMWLDKNGKLNWISNINETIYQKYKGTDLSYRPYFTIPKYTHTVYYSSLIQSNDKVPRLYISYPVINTTGTTTSTGKFTGVVVASIRLEMLGNFLKNQIFTQFNSTIGLLDRKGIILYTSPKPFGITTNNQQYVGEYVFGDKFQSGLSSLLPPESKNLLNDLIKKSLQGNTGSADIPINDKIYTIAYQPVVIAYDGGYADYVVVPTEAIASIPAELSATEAAPLMCAGITTYNALRNSGAREGDTVAIIGVGGLGHLGIQFASKMGFKTIAIGRGKEKEDLVKKLGAARYIDSKSQNTVEELVKLGGAKIILGTVPSGKAMGEVLGGLAVNGKLIMIGVSDEPLVIPPTLFILGRRSVVGWPAGTSMDSQDTLSFSVLSGVRSMNEVFPLERAPEAYERMMSGKARFRAVLTTGH